ncbi:GntR family transcriptional regulator, partial [Actinomadura sp. CNU-125]|uniref:aminotransferase-like domain-containing protein n=1 Tax=Actinomadura sp. CNU-125 TaxID=1904961 RepID=UPI0009619EDC
PSTTTCGPAAPTWPRSPATAGWPPSAPRWAPALPDDALAYPDPAGAFVLRAELAGYLGRVRAAHTDPDRIVITNGVAHALSALARLLRANGRAVLAVEDPTSARQLPMLQSTGVRLARVPVDEQGIDVAALARTDARVVLVTPAHQYPTGVVLSAARRARLIAWARERDGLIIEDDYDAEFRYDREPVGCLQGIDPERVVLLGSVSKALAPAIRLGWAALPPPLAARLRTHRLHTDLGTPVLPQYTLAEYLRGGGYDRHLRAMRRRYRVRRDALADAIRRHVPGARVHGVSAGIHLYVELPPGCDEERVIDRASRAGLSVAGARPMWSPGRAAHARPALVLGYAGLGEGHLVNAAELLGQAVANGAQG